jgi:DNA-binding CsgD family transcriptional regulator
MEPDIFNNMIGYSSESFNKINKICSPMHDLLNMNYFAYQKVTINNEYYCVASDPTYLEFYLKNSCYIYDPYLRFPRQYLYGRSIMPIISMGEKSEEFSDWDRLVNICRKDFKIYHWLLIVNRTFDYYEICCLGLGVDNLKILQNFLSNTHLLNRFISYYKKNIIEPSNDKLSNIKIDFNTLRGEQFQTENTDNYQIDNKNLLKLIKELDPQAETLQKSISDLTTREFDCLIWLVKGKTADETAKLLSISCRTVEKHRENIKRKLGNYSNITYLAYLIGKYNIAI